MTGVWYALAGVGLLFAGMTAAGLLLGQFRRGIIAELRESLETAKTEIEINRSIVSRLEAAMLKVEGRCEHLEGENRVLHTAVETGAALVPFIREEFERFEMGVAQRHKILAQSLPDPIKNALLDALS